MLRLHENSDAFKAGVLSISVHVLLLGALLISFNWKAAHLISVAEVELWESLPTESAQKPLPMPEPEVKPKPVKEIPKPEPVIESELEPKPQVDIVIKKKTPEKPIKKEPPKQEKKPDALAELQKKFMQEALHKPAPAPAPVDDALKKLQQDILNPDNAGSEQKQQVAKTAASAGIVDEFKTKIQAKIRTNVNKSLCGDGNPELKYEIGLLPTGELSGSPKLTKSSGNAACDDAVERAIRASEPLPIPSDSALFAQFRILKLTFRPNEQ